MQLHCPGLAVWQQHSGLRPSQRPASRPAWVSQHCRRPVERTHISTCSSNTADGGDVVRPSAKASAPPLPTTAAVTDETSSAAATPLLGSSRRPSASGDSSPGGNSSAGSYSEFYKAVNSTQYSLAAGVQPVSADTSTNSTPGGNGSRPSNSDSGHKDALQPGASSASFASAEKQAVLGVQDSCSTPVSSAVTQQLQEQQPSTSSAAGVEDAIRKAQEALAAAESNLSSIHKLRSAQTPSRWRSLLLALKSLAAASAAGALLVASHAFGLGWQWAGATIGALVIAAQAFKQRNVTEAGAVAAAAACLATFGCSLRFGLVLLAVSYSSCKLRQFKEARVVPDFSAVGSTAAAQQHQQVEQEPQAPRDWLEVAGVAAIPTILAVAYGAMAGCLDLPLGTLPSVETSRADLLTLLQGAVLGWYACICGDAWSSELGELSADQPRLLTTLQPVRKGTHGGVTLLGLTGAAAGGLLVGVVFFCAAVLSPTLWVFEAQRAAAMAQWRVIPLGLIAGLCGSLLDSLLGATLQFTGYDTTTASVTSRPGPTVQRISGLQLPWLTDHVVNVAAASVTAALTALAALATFG